ncbi:MAG: imidazole glycerol phosphate synthase subunit HisH [Beggiatoa sp. IS2]|nr:MAG: imidazole glycerol phosphate synthase subunit HisH [Beggiatoa sp. IS2]
MSKKLAIVDYGMSNLRSVSKALEHVADRDWSIQVTDNSALILNADKVVFPGQGAIGNCMQCLTQTGLKDAVQQSMDKKPFLGICLGLQTLLTTSEESGGTSCFDKIAGHVTRFPESLFDPHSGERLKIPHMGWNQVFATQSHALWKNIPSASWFYFVHSYFVDPIAKDVIAGTTDYGAIHFASAIAYDNIFAVQFHPEKSQHAGLTLLKNFLDWYHA